MIEPKNLVEGQLIEFAGGWRAEVSEPVRADVAFVRTVGDGLYRHHGFGLDHPIWQSAQLVEAQEKAEEHGSAV